MVYVYSPIRTQIDACVKGSDDSDSDISILRNSTMARRPLEFIPLLLC